MPPCAVLSGPRDMTRDGQTLPRIGRPITGHVQGPPLLHPIDGIRHQAGRCLIRETLPREPLPRRELEGKPEQCPASPSTRAAKAAREGVRQRIEPAVRGLGEESIQLRQETAVSLDVAGHRHGHTVATVERLEYTPNTLHGVRVRQRRVEIREGMLGHEVRLARGEQLPVGREVGVHGRPLHTGAPRDLGDRRARWSHLLVEARGRGCDPATCLLLALRAFLQLVSALPLARPVRR